MIRFKGLNLLPPPHPYASVKSVSFVFKTFHIFQYEIQEDRHLLLLNNYDRVFHLQKYVFDYYCLLYNNHHDLTFLQAAPNGAQIGVVYGLLQTVRLLMER